MEFAGDTTSPFDEGGLFWGYGFGQNPSVINRELFETSGVLVMDRLLEGMQAQRARFPDQSYEIKEYMKVNAYVLLNVAFDRFVETDAFKALNTGDPFFFYAAEHDHSRKLIYRIQS